MKELKYNPRLPLDQIDVSPSNVRRTNLEEGIDDLANSIREIGILQPVEVFKTPGGRFELIIGQRRYLACKRLGLKEIPALITTVKDETDATIKSFSENIHRLDLEYRDKMQAASELFNKFKSVAKVAEHLGVSSQTVKNYLGYAAVSDQIKKMVDEDKLSATTALGIWRSIPDERLAVKIAEKVVETPRSEDKRKLIDTAKENPKRSENEIVRLAKTQKFRKVTIDLTSRIADALSRACQQYNNDAKDITKEALEEWLKKRGFIK